MNRETTSNALRIENSDDGLWEISWLEGANDAYALCNKDGGQWEFIAVFESLEDARYEAARLGKGSQKHSWRCAGQGAGANSLGSVHDCYKYFMLPSCDFTLSERLHLIHKHHLKELFNIDRIAVTLYHHDTDLLKTYAHSTLDDSPLEHYQTNLDDIPALKDIAKTGKVRVVHNIPSSYISNKQHSRHFVSHDFLSSYTVPLIKNHNLVGFMFANSKKESNFTPEVIDQLDSYMALIGNIVVSEITALKILSGSISTLNHISRHRDSETGTHLSRMAHYSYLIARTIARKFNLSDEFVEHIYLFSPLHDIGKIAIPDSILLKPDRLTEQEFDAMKEHTILGEEMIEQLVTNMDLSHTPFISALTNIVKYHHEKMDGTGYPENRSGDDIPIEARITAVADIFDALTSERPYKKAWSNYEAITWMKECGKHTLDQRLVEALEVNMDDVASIQKRFIEDEYG